MNQPNKILHENNNNNNNLIIFDSLEEDLTVLFSFPK